MTKLEALAKDCIENHTHRLVDRPTKQDIYLREESIFIQGYRQSEKRIAELEAQIEKMKCCGNCKHYKPVVTVNESISNMCEDYYYGCNNNIYEPFNKWELKEK